MPKHNLNIVHLKIFLILTNFNSNTLNKYQIFHAFSNGQYYWRNHITQYFHSPCLSQRPHLFSIHIVFIKTYLCFAYNRTITWSILILSWHFDTRNLLLSVKGKCIGPMSGALQDPPLSSWSVIFNSVPWCPCIIPGKWIESRQWGGKVR